MVSKFKRYVGALLFDLPRFLFCMRPNWMFSGTHAWLLIRNRNEKLVGKSGHVGVSCNWKWTSNIVIANWFPALGRWLMRRALSEFPVLILNSRPNNAEDTGPDISFLIGHRGLDRLPALLMTLESIAGQIGCRTECV